MIAVVLVRGMIGVNKDIVATLRMLHLYRKNYCSMLEANPRSNGMLFKAKDYITWGTVDEETRKSLLNKSEKNFYRLQPPRKGYGRKGIKKPFSSGGALGERKEKINDLINRML